MKQQTLAMAAGQGFERHRKPTRRDTFLETMNRVIPWDAQVPDRRAALSEEGKWAAADRAGAHAAHSFPAALFNLTDLPCEQALYHSATLRRFAGIDLGSEPVPKAITLFRFRRLLEQHKLAECLFVEVGRVLQVAACVTAGVNTSGPTQCCLSPAPLPYNLSARQNLAQHSLQKAVLRVKTTLSGEVNGSARSMPVWPWALGSYALRKLTYCCNGPFFIRTAYDGMCHAGVI